jgi:putative spermidine/putrescine transport system permease protein
VRALPFATGRGRAARVSTWGSRLAVLSTLAIALALVAPIAVAVWGAFSESPWYGERSEGVGGGSGELFRYVLDLWSGALRRSLLVVALVVPLALLIGAPAAYAFRRLPFRGARFLEAAALVPLAVPGIALAVGLLVAASGAPRFALLILGHLAYTVPLVVETVAAALDGVDPALEDAARTLGAGRLETVARVVLPLVLPALALAALLAFTVSWGEFNVSFLLATPLLQTFPSALYLTYTTNSFPVAAAATVIFLAPVLPALAAIQLLGGRRSLRRGIAA